MKVRCVINDLASIANEKVRSRLSLAVHIEGPVTDLEIGKEYEVHGLIEREGRIWLILHTVSKSEFPHAYPAEFFDITDASLPQGWAVILTNIDGEIHLKRIGFREWAMEESFYENLIDGNEREVAIYQKYLEHSHQRERESKLGTSRELEQGTNLN